MKFNPRLFILGIVIGIICVTLVTTVFFRFQDRQVSDVLSVNNQESYWFVLHRKSNTEELFLGSPGDREGSQLVKTFSVKVGIPGQSPTPLPSLLGREYWLIMSKEDSSDNPETAPYFLKLDIDAPEEWPYGPVPYTECNGEQCDWVKPGFFGLHGVAGDPSRLSLENPGSSGCIRHSDEDITYLYNLLDPANEEVRYYVEDN